MSSLTEAMICREIARLVYNFSGHPYYTTLNYDHNHNIIKPFIPSDLISKNSHLPLDTFSSRYCHLIAAQIFAALEPTRQHLAETALAKLTHDEIKALAPYDQPQDFTIVPPKEKLPK